MLVGRVAHSRRVPHSCARFIADEWGFPKDRQTVTPLIARSRDEWGTHHPSSRTKLGGALPEGLIPLT